ncbi:MAG: FecR domain-containing protein [Parcubacteria group bacterium]|nr:FecR domain-containing protein [Parcubacteria group bacterium]
MKSLIIVVLVLLGLGTGVYLLSTSKTSTTVTPEATISNNDGSGLSDLIVLASEVFIKNPGDADFVRIEKQAKIKEGSEIKTSSTGRATVRFPNGTISNLTRDTSIILKELSTDGNKSRIQILAGGIWSKIENILGKGDVYEIETENMVASVRGTIFASKLIDHISSIYVLENKVGVKVKNPKTNEILEDVFNFIQVEEGEKTSVNTNKLPTKANPLKKSLITKDDLDQELIKENLGGEYLERESIQKLFLKLIQAISPNPTSSNNTLKPLTSSSVTSSPSSVLIQPVSTPTPTPTPVPKPESTIESVTPDMIEASSASGAELAVNGSNLFGTKKVLLNQISLDFFVVDTSTIFASLPENVEPGVYDVSIVTSSNKTLTLNQALQVR